MEKLQNKIPQVRFPEFKDDWENIIFDDFLIFTPRPILKPKENYLSIGIRSHFKGTFQKPNTDPTKNVMDTLYMVKENDFLVNITFAWEGALAIIPKEDEGGLVSHRFPTYTFKKDKVLNIFFKYSFFREKSKHQLGIVSPGGAGRNRVLNKKDFLKLKCLFPTIPEQKRIANFFTILDNKINQLKEKKALLEDYKKGMMQRIFAVGEKSITNKSITNYELGQDDNLTDNKTRNSSFVNPNYIRFKDDNGNNYPKWEEKKLKEIAEINPKNAELPKSFIYIDLESVVKGRLNKKERVSVENAPSRAQRILKRNDILFQMVRPYQRNNFFFDIESSDYVASTGYAQIRTKNNALFLYQLLHADNFVNKVENKCTGTGYPAINSSDLSKISINIPSIPEQTKIANFLSKIDDKIKTVNEQIEQSKEYKKGLLQKMYCV